MSVELRPALPADGPRLAALGRRVFTETFGANYDAADLARHLDRAFGPHGLPAELADPSFRVMMAEEDGTAVAYLKLGPMALRIDHPPGSLEIKQLYVLAPWQGKGVARRLMDQAIAHARAAGAPALYLSVWTHGDRAIAFYRRCGFVIAGTAPFTVGARTDEDPVMRLDLESEVEVGRASMLADIPHGFLGRRGGVSQGFCAGLNVGLGSDDDREAIAENRRRAVEAVAPGAQLVTVHQVHSAQAVYAAGPWPNDARPQADAIVTDRPGLVLGILTADCTPLLFADRQAGVIAAAHAGWKGAFGGVIESTLALMEQHGADRDRVVAAVGPVIARRSYEVDEAFLRRFSVADPENDRFFSPGRTGHHQFDLEAYVLARLAEAGITRAEALGLDTYSDPDRFYSYRRATHRGEPDYGRQISLIALPV